MTRTIRTLTLAAAAVLLVPASLPAQPGQGAPGARAPQGRPGATRAPVERTGPRGGDGRADAITRLLDARRQLDLTPRQIVQLDSLERVQYAERRQFGERMRGARDSMMTRARSESRTPAARDSLRAQARARIEAERPQIEQRRRRDSSMNAAAERILNDTQRQKMREMVAERRGYERGMRESRGQGGAQRGRGGVRPGRPEGRPAARPDGRPSVAHGRRSPHLPTRV